MDKIKSLLTRIRTPPSLKETPPQHNPPPLLKLKSSSKLPPEDLIGSLGLQLLKFYQGDSRPLLSPASVGMILSLIYWGSGGETYTLLNKYFGSVMAIDVLTQFQNLITDLKSTPEVALTHHLVYRHDMPPRSEFKNTTQYTTTITPHGLKSGAETLALINTLSSKDTNGRFSELIRNIDPEAYLMFLTGMSFGSKWSIKFTSARTTPEFFHGLEITTLSMMTQFGNCHMYAESSDYQLVEVTFHGHRYTMGFLLPKKKSSQFKVENLTSQKLQNLVDNLKEVNIDHLQIPKFSVHQEYDLKPFFYDLGLGVLFQDAYFSGIYAQPDSRSVAKFTHQVSIAIDEDGTRPSTDQHDTANYSAKNQIKFIADHSFLYYVRHYERNAIVMMGLMQ